MGVDAKEIIVILWKILGYSMNMSIKFMRNHPILSGVSMFLLVLYIFLPTLLFFLIYSSPVLACALVYAREKLGLRFSSSYSEPKKSCGGEKRCHLKQQRSVRRNARMKVEEWDSQTSEEEKDKVILTSLYNDLLGRTPHFEESPKALETNVVEEEDNEKEFLGEEDSRDLGQLNVEEPMVCNCEIKYGESDGKEEMKEEMSNVNEQGISEIERNKRLESLIARRRARRLFRLALDQRNKLQAEETTSPRQNNTNSLHVTVSRNSLEKRRNNSSDGTTVKGLPIPGSAPSVLLQGRNPFDIPYDPQEERPNLTGDSFDQEFSLFNQKDMFFCRHESFCRFALFSPEHAQCMNSPVSASDISTTRKRLDLDNEYMDHTEQNLPCNGKGATIEDDDKSVVSGKSEEREVEMNDNETDSNKEECDDSSCSEESESELSRLNKAELREAICQSMDNNPGYLVNQTRNSIPTTLPRGLVAPRLDDNNMFYARKCGNSHSRTFSVASDMQVEVSEIGSPPTTVDWLDDWSNGGESYIYDTDIDREIVRDEESRKRISHQYESRSGIGSKEENNETWTKPEAKPNQNCVVDENLITVDDDLSLLERRSQTEEIFEQTPSSSNDVSKPTSSGKFEGMLFHTSASLSSITEEPETILDSIDGGNSENLNNLTEELTDPRPLTTLDSSMKKLIDEEVADVKQVENDDLCGSPKIIDLDIIDHQQKDQMLSSIQGEHGETKSFLDASLDTSYIESFERELEGEEESNLDKLTKETTKQTENEVHQSDLESSPCQVLTELLVSEIMEENGQELEEEEKPRSVEEEKTHNVVEESSSHAHTQLVEDYGNEENASDVILLQFQDSNNSPLDESTDQEVSKEGEKTELLEDFYGESSEVYKNRANAEVYGNAENASDVTFLQVQDGNYSPRDELLKDFYDESSQEYKNRANVEEESVVLANTQNSQDSQTWTQQCGIDSSQGISPRTLEITQQLEKDDVIDPNAISQVIDTDEFAAVGNDVAASESNDEEILKLDEQDGVAMEKELELNLESLHHNTGLVAREDDEESKKVIEEMQNAGIQTTKDENRVLG
ncbi:predicted protein [Arabidopsis lyrata subsp. lyrata]|uniref:Predicted protein n=1 Tax=Arabidopsis lyrata subsp. lyrata TaxID=81972 RepID=D7MR42_ARALL|nr:predicted protein [Arabidopsis lyrata subsp. lyrata]